MTGHSMRGQPSGGWLGEERHDPMRVLLGELLMVLDPRDPTDSQTWLVGERPATPVEVALVHAATLDEWDAARALVVLDDEMSRNRWARARCVYVPRSTNDDARQNTGGTGARRKRRVE